MSGSDAPVARRLAAAVETYLVVWVTLAVVVGLLVPAVATITRLSTLLLAVMVASVSLTLSVEQFRALRTRWLVTALAAHATMPLLAYAVAVVAGLSPPLTAGFVVLGAVTPELVAPVMTALGEGDTALATTTLVAAAVGALVLLPASISLFVAGAVSVRSAAVVRQVAVALVAPLVVAVGVRRVRPAAVERHEAYYPAVAALMVVLVVCGVTAANADTLRSAGTPLVPVVAAALALNLGGYAVGWVASRGEPRPVRVATTLSVGMRDFAVAAALVVGAGLAPVVAVPAVVFGVVEMVSSAALARAFASRDASGREKGRQTRANP